MPDQAKPFLDRFHNRLGENPSLDDLERAAKHLAYEVFTERGKLQELADWVNGGLDPDYQPPQRTHTTHKAEADDFEEQLAGGIRYDSWAWEYAKALTRYLTKRMREDPITQGHRAKYGTVEGESDSSVWGHLLALVKASGVDPEKSNPKLARLPLYLGPGFDPKTGEDVTRESIPIPAKPVPELADLLSAIREVTAKYRVSNAAALYAITQDALAIYHTPYKVRALDGKAPFRRIVLEVDPKLPAEDVKRIYSRARKAFGWESKPIIIKNLKLADTACRFEEESWEDLLDLWDGRHEDSRYLPEFPSFAPETQVTDAEVERTYDDYYRKKHRAEKNFMRDVNAAWRWVFGTDPPKRKELGEKTANRQAILEKIKRHEAEAQTEKPQEPVKKPRKRTKRGESL
jgi:hypothetical protein